MRTEQLARIAALVLAAAGLVASQARAEPYLMVREGAKCSACHTNVTGGGKRTAFAHIHAHDIEHDLELLPVPPGTKPFNGELNSYVSVGGDLRVKNVSTFEDRPDSLGRVPENRAFRRSVTSNSTSVDEVLGYLQIDLFSDIATFYADENLTSGATNREAFGLLQHLFPKTGYDWLDYVLGDSYFKAGRMFPAYGLRVQDDEAFIRAKSGFTFGNFVEGGEIGTQPGPFFLASSITNSSEPGGKDVQATFHGYGVFEDIPVVRNVVAGASYARRPNTKDVAAFFGGSNIWKFTYLGELDLIDDPKIQYVTYGEVDLLLFDWLNVRGTFDFLKARLDRDATRFAIGLEPFISRVIQPRIQYRINNGPNEPFAPGASASDRATVGAANADANKDELRIELHVFF